MAMEEKTLRKGKFYDDTGKRREKGQPESDLAGTARSSSFSVSLSWPSTTVKVPDVGGGAGRNREN